MVKTWVNSRWKNPRLTGQFSTEINRHEKARPPRPGRYFGRASRKKSIRLQVVILI
ncbi:hypothetical protein BO1005MUT1_320001 [Hyphomicrobiales bacterium]|nr:hypothetical protein BO1005MUT1_320001 [Hyphomicrobiales bacterium]